MHRLLDDIVVLSAARTPVGRFRGSLSLFDAIDLGAFAISAAIERAGVDASGVDTVNMGMVVSAGYGLAPAKAAALRAGLSTEAHTRAVESVCGSAMDAIGLAIESLLAGTAKLAIAGGMESRTNAPYLVGPTFRRDKGECRRGERLRVTRAGAYRFQLSEDPETQLECTGLVDPTTYDGLFWPAERKFMRQYALEFAAAHGVKLEDVNRWSAESHRRARDATEKGLFREEIVPCGEVDRDDLVPDERLDKKMADKPDDIASLFNSSTPADAAAALVVTTEAHAELLDVKPIARLLGYARVDGPAGEYLIAPVNATRLLMRELEAAGRSAEFTIAEANEAFGIQLPVFHEAFPGVEINVHGGAVALGHPLGSAGARITTTLLYAMKRYDHRLGFATICYGGGGGYALALGRDLGWHL